MTYKQATSILCRIPSLMATTLLAACGADMQTPQSPKPRLEASASDEGVHRSTQTALALAGPTSAWCPEGASLDTKHWLCIDGINALGPFPPAMIETCLRSGGGQQACNSERWDATLAQRIRGSSDCPPGTSLDPDLGECRNGESIYGPFSQELVSRCLAATNSSQVCKTQRIHRSFASSSSSGTANRSPLAVASNPLRVPYFYQYNNALEPGSTCNITSVAMVAQYYGISVTPDQIYRRIGGPVFTGPDMLWAARQYGLRGTYSQTASIKTIKAHIDAGQPVIIQGWFTKSGHIMVITGYDNKGWIVNDPAGFWAGCYACGYPARTESNGKGARYSYAAMERAATDPGDPSSYWITVLTR